MISAPAITDERGTTLVELLVGLAAGMVILSALTLVIVVTLHGAARVSARVESTQRARGVVSEIMEELHSACVAPQVAPLKGESTGSKLEFIRAPASQKSAVSPEPVRTVITFANGTLTQTDYPATGGASPNWTFGATPSATRQLLTKVSPATPTGSIFTYYKYLNGSLSQVLTTPLGEEAAMVIEVKVALQAAPTSTPIRDAAAGTLVQDSAVLRLTPPSFNEQAVALPCQ